VSSSFNQSPAKCQVSGTSCIKNGKILVCRQDIVLNKAWKNGEPRSGGKTMLFFHSLTQFVNSP
jgi:hypothetical protein